MPQTLEFSRINFKNTKVVDISKAYNIAVRASEASDSAISSEILRIISETLYKAKKDDRTIDKIALPSEIMRKYK